MNSHIRVPARASIWYIASALIGRGIGFFFTPIFTRLMGEGEYGAYTLYLNWLGIFTIISTLEISGGIYMRSLQKSEDKNRLFRSAVLLEILSIAVFCILYFVFYGFISRFTQLGALLSLIAFIQILFTAITNLYLTQAKFYYRYKEVFLINVAAGALPIPIALLLVGVFGLGEYGKISATLAITVVIAAYVIYHMLKHGRDVSIHDMRELLAGGAAHLPHYLSTAVVGRADKLILSSVYGTAALAKYAVAENVGALLLFGITAPLSALTPWIMRRLASGEPERIRQVGKIGTSLILWISLILLCYAPEILAFLAPAEYSEALFAAFPLALTAIPAFLFSLSSVAMLYGDNKLSSLLPSLVGGAVAVLAATLLSRFPHFTALAFTQPIAQLVMLGVSYVTLGRRGITVIDIKAVLPLLAVGVGASLTLFLARDFLMLRIIISIACLLPLVFELGRGAALVKEKPSIP